LGYFVLSGFYKDIKDVCFLAKSFLSVRPAFLAEKYIGIGSQRKRVLLNEIGEK